MGNRMSFYSSTSSYASSSHVTSSPSKSFKKVIRPFLRACHPDAMMGAFTEQTADDIAPSTTHHGKRTRPLSQQAKETNNLKAVQEYTMGQQQRKQIDQWNLSYHFLHELGIDPMHDETTSSSNQRTQSGAYFGRT